MTTLAVQISSFKRPSEIPKHTWRHLLSVLRALTKYLPDPFPSQRELARRVNLDQRTVGRLLVRAEELGFIHRTPRVTSSGHQSYSYALLFEAKREANASEEDRSSPTEKNLSSYGPAAHQNPHVRKVNRWTGACCVCSFPVQPKEGWLHGKLPVHRECDQGRPDLKYEREHQGDLNPSGVIGEDPTSAQGTTTVTTDPASKLATRFETLWFTEALAQYPAWREHRAMHKGPAIGYLRSQFLAKGYSPEYVGAYFEAFFDELLDPHSTLELREGQTPWQLFTGWWGQTPVADPAIDRARREENQRLHDRFESKIAAEQPARDAARARLFALADGEVGDPEDYRLAGLPMPVKKFKFG